MDLERSGFWIALAVLVAFSALLILSGEAVTS
jgi:hypothetical protein